MSQTENQNIQVFIRSRPLKETETRSKIEIFPENGIVKSPQRTYLFDHVYAEHAGQVAVYKDVVSPLVMEVVEGYNCTVFAYGQTGTGKTHTMIGYRDDANILWENDPSSGIIPRAIDQLLDLLHDSNTEFSVRVSFLEIYNEYAYDLLAPLSDNSKLRIYQDQERKGSVVIAGLTEISVTTKREIYEILEKGSIKRQTAATLMNALSSRSHTIFSVTVHMKEVTDEQEEIVKVGKLNLVDLAGSENVGRSGAVEDRARETSNINKSLLTLGRVITSLVDKKSHIPYRDSKLTRLLQDSLGGRTKTSIIATISPSVEDYEDTVSTLDYAQRAKKITNKPEINLKLKKGEIISNYLKEIERLRRDLEASKDKKGRFVDAKNYDEMIAKLDQQEKLIQEKEVEEDALKKNVKNWKTLEVELKMTIDEKDDNITGLNNELEKLQNNLKNARTDLEDSRIKLAKNRAVIEAHLTAEQKLLKEAETVRKVTDRCVDDNSKLFDKIQNLKSLENINMQNIVEYFENFNKHFELVQSFNRVYKQRLSQSFETIENLSKTERIQTKCNEATKLLQNFTSKFNQFKDDIEVSFKKEENLSSEFQKTTFDQLENLRSQMNEFQNAFLKSSQAMFYQLEIVQAVIGETIDQRQKVEQIYLDLDAKLKQDSKNFQISFQTQKNDIQDIFKLKEKNHADVLERMDFLATDFASLKSKISEDHVKEHELLKHTSMKCDVVSNDLQKQTCNNLGILTQLNKDGHSHTQKVIDIGTEHKKNLELHEKFIASRMTAHSEFNNELVKSIKSLPDSHMCSSFNRIHREREAFLDDFTTVMDEFRKVNLRTVEAINQAAKTIEGDLKKSVKKEKEAIYSIVGRETEHIESCAEINQEFFLSKLPNYSYKETGKTPRRMNYNYPNKFTTTSPHARIIERAIGMNKILKNIENIENMSNVVNRENIGKIEDRKN